jgi:phage FluMu protein Com
MAERSNDARDERCECGNLLARRTERGIEVKCRRCKRTVVIPLETDSGDKRGPP